MAGYLKRRLFLATLTLCVVLVVTFFMIRLAPGDPALAFFDEARADKEQLARLRHRLGLDAPLMMQIVHYAGRVAQGELGYSYFTHEPVGVMILNRLPFTLELALTAILLSTVLGLLLGILAARHQNRSLDLVIATAAVTVYSFPRFWIGLLLILAFAVVLPWFPVVGVGDEGNVWDQMYHLVLPMLAVALPRIGMLARITRNSLLDVLGQDYVRTARSKGLAEQAVFLRHALRNALIPVITVVGLGLGSLLSGSIVVETVFARTGLGTLLIDAVRARDYPVVQGTVLFFALGTVAVNIAVDFLYAIVDPRIRYG